MHEVSCLGNIEFCIEIINFLFCFLSYDKKNLTLAFIEYKILWNLLQTVFYSLPRIHLKILPFISRNFYIIMIIFAVFVHIKYNFSMIIS